MPECQFEMNKCEYNYTSKFLNWNRQEWWVLTWIIWQWKHLSRLNISTARKCERFWWHYLESVYFFCFWCKVTDFNELCLFELFILNFSISALYSILWIGSSVFHFSFRLFANNKQWADSESLHPILRSWTVLLLFSLFSIVVLIEYEP